MMYVAEKDPNRTLTLILYILYILAIFTGGILAIIALIINYVKRSSVQGSIAASHFTWQIRTFWYYVFWNLLAFVPFLFLLVMDPTSDALRPVILGAVVFCALVVLAAWIWIIYRAFKGIIRLNNGEAMPV